jgi:hypothetical protein
MIPVPAVTVVGWRLGEDEEDQLSPVPRSRQRLLKVYLKNRMFNNLETVQTHI